jgi:hypothetical protein
MDGNKAIAIAGAVILAVGIVFTVGGLYIW